MRRNQGGEVVVALSPVQLAGVGVVVVVLVVFAVRGRRTV